MKNIPARIILTEEDTPKYWYNIVADMPEVYDPMLNPATLQPVAPADLYPIFAKELCAQEMTKEALIEIPDEIRQFYKMYRPSPLHRAYQLEKMLDTPAHIYYKYEGGNTSGSHKLNSAIAQVYYNKKQGIQKITTETGAGQWGTALAIACSYFGMELEVYMVKTSAMQKPYRKAVMETFGAKVIESPSPLTNTGRNILKENPDCPGSLGIAISEAVEMAVSGENTRYSLGSVLNQVLIHQSVIGLEAKSQIESVGEYPDLVIGCAGGGSNFGGLIAPFMRDRILNETPVRFLAVEPASCPSLTQGRYAYDFCDTGKVTPLAKMYTLGSGFLPSPIHAGGLRYHGMSPILSKLYHDKLIDEAVSVKQSDVFAAAVAFSKCEGILPAPESAHAIRAAMDEAVKCRESGRTKTILFGLTGSGQYDLGAYMQYNNGTMVDYIPTDEDLKPGFDSLPKVDLAEVHRT